jgi:2,4-dienoyl-CoA reductase-like NADH-dependent reductase (Old Yellow Enzyme family)
VTRRALAASFQVVEIHAVAVTARIFSPLTNKRTDAYGGPFENRVRLLREVVAAVRGVWPDRLPLFVRISVTDWVEGGWDLEQSILLSGQLKSEGVDLIDCSSGGIVPGVTMPIGPGYQTSFAERNRRDTGILTGAVGMITAAEQADTILRTGQADVVVLARELPDPYWPPLPNSMRRHSRRRNTVARCSRGFPVRAARWFTRHLRAAAQPRIQRASHCACRWRSGCSPACRTVCWSPRAGCLCRHMG